jgi:site-specific DNA recombinase
LALDSEVRVTPPRETIQPRLVTSVQDVNQRGWLNKEWKTKSGLARGGKTFDKCSIYTLLTNPLYAGLIRHKDLLHKGEHEPIIEASMFNRSVH